MDNRKNTILLTVIAVATLLVAVVGATFAYFTAQGGSPSTADATVKTETADSSSFTTNALALAADQDSFATGKGNATASATGSASFTANTHDDSSDLCYTVKFKVTANGFGYRPAGTDPELLLTVSKTVQGGSETEITTAITGLTHKTGVVGADKNGTAQDAISGYDITEFGKTAGATVTIPDGSNSYHKITANKGVTSVDNWNFTATLVNYDWDQNYNAGKVLSGTIEFAKVDCPSA